MSNILLIEYIKKLAFCRDNTLFHSKIDEIFNKRISNIREILIKILSLLDITTLNDTDNKKAIKNILNNLTCRVGKSSINVAGLCIYSNLLPILNQYYLPQEIKKVAVSGGFPTGQLSFEAKIRDIQFAINNKVDEIDIPINRGMFFEDKASFTKELKQISQFIRAYSNNQTKLKVILETSELTNYENIYKASVIAMECGADFIKTSTGKVSRGADVYSSVIMLVAIKEYLQKTGKKVGFKAAGGIRTWQEAIKYYILVEKLLGEEYLHKDTFRIGCSNLRDNILREINNN